MKKYLVKSVYKRILVTLIIYIILAFFSSYIAISNGSYSVDYSGVLFFGYLVLFFANILAAVSLIFGYKGIKKSFNSVSLKNLFSLSLVLSFLFSFVNALIYFICLKMMYGSNFLFNTSFLVTSFITSFIVYVLLYWIVIYLISFWVIFERAGEKGWTFLVPFYSIIIMLKITKKPDWWFFLFLIPIVNIIFVCVVNYELAKKFNKYDDFAIGAAILPIIFYPFIAFGKDEYQK